MPEQRSRKYVVFSSSIRADKVYKNDAVDLAHLFYAPVKPKRQFIYVSVYDIESNPDLAQSPHLHARIHTYMYIYPRI